MCQPDVDPQAPPEPPPKDAPRGGRGVGRTQASARLMRPLSASGMGRRAPAALVADDAGERTLRKMTLTASQCAWPQRLLLAHWLVPLEVSLPGPPSLGCSGSFSFQPGQAGVGSFDLGTVNVPRTLGAGRSWPAYERRPFGRPGPLSALGRLAPCPHLCHDPTGARAPRSARLLL